MSFCGKKILHLHPRIESRIRAQLQTIYYVEPDVQIPLNREVLDESYLVTIQKNKSFYGGLFLIDIDHVVYHIFIFNFQLYPVQLEFANETLYKGTMFVGDLVHKQNRWTFFINDIVFHEGNTVHLNLAKRLLLIYKTLKQDFRHDPLTSICDIHLSPYFVYNHIPLLKHPCTIMFVPDVPRNSKPKMWFSLKHPKATHSNAHGDRKTFTVNQTDIVDVYTIHELSCNLCVASMDESKFLKHKFKSDPTQKLLCQFDSYFDKWRPCCGSSQ